jgi:hypothetical protein
MRVMDYVTVESRPVMGKVEPARAVLRDITGDSMDDIS